MKNNKKILIFTTNDSIFTLPVIYKICKLFKEKKIDIYCVNPEIKRGLKVLLIFLLFGSLTGFIKAFKKRIKLKDILNMPNVKLINNNNGNYNYAISFNFPKKIALKKYKIYNFHCGNFINQRGSFIFFYKYLYEWKNLYLTFHEINSRLDSGPIINQKKINIIKKNPIEICSLYLDNYFFIKNSLNKIKNYNKKIMSLGKLNKEPNIFLIIKTFLKNF